MVADTQQSSAHAAHFNSAVYRTWVGTRTDDRFAENQVKIGQQNGLPESINSIQVANRHRAAAFHLTPVAVQAPKAQGRSSDRVHRLMAHWASPGSAGMILELSVLWDAVRCKPRTPGDQPHKWKVSPRALSQAPHSRGSTRNAVCIMQRYGADPASMGSRTYLRVHVLATNPQARGNNQGEEETGQDYQEIHTQCQEGAAGDYSRRGRGQEAETPGVRPEKKSDPRAKGISPPPGHRKTERGQIHIRHMRIKLPMVQRRKAEPRPEQSCRDPGSACCERWRQAA